MASLRELMLVHWGYDLPIAGGWGQTIDDPIVIDATKSDVVAFTEMQVLQGIGRGRGVYWRRLDRVLVSTRPRIERLKIETVKLTLTEKLTEVIDYYFDVSALAEEWLPIEGVLHLQRFDFQVPCEIGWLHAGAIADNEALVPGSGVAVRYGAPAVNATVFIYDWGRINIPEDVTHPLVQNEFERASRDIGALAPQAEAWPDPPFNGQYLSRHFKTGSDGNDNMLVALTTSNRKFVKMQVAWQTGEFINEVTTGWVNSIAHLARAARA